MANTHSTVHLRGRLKNAPTRAVNGHPATGGKSRQARPRAPSVPPTGYRRDASGAKNIGAPTSESIKMWRKATGVWQFGTASRIREASSRWLYQVPSVSALTVPGWGIECDSIWRSTVTKPSAVIGVAAAALRKYTVTTSENRPVA